MEYRKLLLQLERAGSEVWAVDLLGWGFSSAAEQKGRRIGLEYGVLLLIRENDEGSRMFLSPVLMGSFSRADLYLSSKRVLASVSMGRSKESHTKDQIEGQ